MASQDDIADDAVFEVDAPDNAAQAPSPSRSFATDSTGRLDPTALMSKRTHSRRNFTRSLNMVRKVIHETGASSYTDSLIEKGDAHYEQCMYYHHRYCAKMGISDDAWLDNLRLDFEATHEEFARARRLGQHTVASIRTRSQVRPSLVESARQPDLAPLDPARQYLSLRTSRQTSEVSQAEAILVPTRGSHRKTDEDSPQSVSSSKSSIARSVSSSYLSRSSTRSSLTRERRAAEFELEMARKRREEESKENKRLDELARKLREEKIHVEARRKERKIEEEIARLRMNEELSRRSIRSSSRTSFSSLSESDEDFFPVHRRVGKLVLKGS
ncbi:hypothetical protein OUZ56_026237 [Daphnia magna]|uniref:Uncharacterized protein n=1 Tax=Daphnia magna TaxID=35525 RepID=A0ABQ9ZL58_9CRUS|nr:hypothetical protein OUZ56_026237 [Daphnia magna]